MTDADRSFRLLAAQAVDAVLAFEPELATSLGRHEHDHRMNDRTVDGLAAQASSYRSLLAELADIRAADLHGDDRVDAAILANALESRVFAIEELRELEWNPLNYVPGNALYPLLARPILPAADRLEAVAARLRVVPEIFEICRRQLRRPPRVHLETALGQNQGALLLVRDKVARLQAEEPRLDRVVGPARAAAIEAIEAHGRWLGGILEEGADGEFRIGADRFGRKLRLALHSELSAEAVLARAHAHLAELEDHLFEAACAQVGAGTRDDREATIRRALDAVAERRPNDATIVAEATDQLAALADAVRDLGIAKLPSDPCKVEVMPEFRRGVAVAYCDSPGPFEQGGDTFLAVAPTPADWSAERIESFYREYNSAALVNLMVHEGFPGHALQLAHNRGFRGTTPVRQAFRSGPFVEGWAVHAERLMVEAGHGGPPVRLQQLKMQLRMTINAILDAEVHAGGLTEEAALELMMRRGYQEEGEAAGKWRRACLGSAQLSTYFVGYTELAPVLSGRGPGSNFDDVLAHGSPPPSLLAGLL